jgi:hypothetical protein
VLASGIVARLLSILGQSDRAFLWGSASSHSHAESIQDPQSGDSFGNQVFTERVKSDEVMMVGHNPLGPGSLHKGKFGHRHAHMEDAV